MSQIIPLFKRIEQKGPAVSFTGEGRLEKFFVFHICGKAFVVPAVDVAEVANYSSLIEIPKAPELVSGVVNVRGTVIPIVTLRERLGYSKDFAIDEKTKVIYFPVKQGYLIGMIVDDIEYRLRDGIIQPSNEKSVGKNNFKTVVIEDKDSSYRLPLFFIDELISQTEFENISKVLDSF